MPFSRSHSSLRVRGWLPRASVAATWVAVVPLAALGAARIGRFDERSTLLTALVTLTPWIFLPAWAGLGVAAAARRRMLACVCAVLVVAHVSWTWPDLPWWQRDQPAATGPALRLVSVNAYKYNERAVHLGQTLLRFGADVVVVQELSPRVREGLRASGFVDRYRHRHETPVEGSFGSGIYSRFPFSEVGFLDLVGYRMPRVTLAVGPEPVDLVSVHTVQPLADAGVLRDQLHDLAVAAAQTTRPLILAGDFNATRQHRPFRRLLATRLRDAHLDHGRGLATTWPSMGRIPPFALIDHVLVTPEIAVAGIAEHDVPGSDHRSLVADLRLPVGAAPAEALSGS